MTYEGSMKGIINILVNNSSHSSFFQLINPSKDMIKI